MSDEQTKTIILEIGHRGEGENREIIVHSVIEETSLKDLMAYFAVATLNHIRVTKDKAESELGSKMELWSYVAYAMTEFNLMLDTVTTNYEREKVELE